jgi:hypothetical protein
LFLAADLNKLPLMFLCAPRNEARWKSALIYAARLVAGNDAPVWTDFYAVATRAARQFKMNFAFFDTESFLTFAGEFFQGFENELTFLIVSGVVKIVCVQ